MTTHNPILATELLPAGKRTQPLSIWIRSAGPRIVTWAETCADYYAATAMYEHLSRLSDAELAQRGLSRATLARDACAACDRGSTP